MQRRLLSFVMGLVFTSTMRAFDSWPQWQGPNRNSASTEKGLLDHWDGAPPLIWKAEGLGAGYAGVVVEGGIVCTMGDRKGKATVIALSSKDGKEIWATEVANSPWYRKYTGSKSTPTIDHERLYAVDATGHLVCLKTTTGERVWEKFYKKDFGGRCREYDGYSESVLVDNDKLICSPGGPKAIIVALNKKTGEELWRCKHGSSFGTHPSAAHGSPVISHGAGVKQYVQLMSHGLFGIAAETGKHLWSGMQTSSHYGIRTPVIRGDHVFSVNDSIHGRSVLLKLAPTADGGVKAEEVYALDGKVLETKMGNIVLVGDYLYATDCKTGSPKCIEFLTGKMMWNNRHNCSGIGGRDRSAAVIYADGNLYFHYVNGVTLLVAATPDKYRLKGQFRIPGPGDAEAQWAYPAISNGRLYLRKGDAIYCYSLKKSGK